MGKIIASIPTKDYIERTLVNPQGNGEKVSEETSSLLHFTAEKCFSCLSSEGTWKRADHYSIRDCLNPNSHLKWTGNSVHQSCSEYQ